MIFLIWSIIGVILGGRIGYVIFYQFKYFLQNPLYIILYLEGWYVFSWRLTWNDPINTSIY